VTAAHIAPAIIDGGIAAPGLLAWVAVSKFADHLPLYRIEQFATRDNVPLPRSNQSEWIGRIGVALQPLADRLSHFLLQRAMLHADETPVAQLDPGKGKPRKLTYGLTAAATWRTARQLSCLTTSLDVVASLRATICNSGRGI
jgi:transposase